MEGKRAGIVLGERMGESVPAAQLVDSTVVSALAKKVGQIAGELPVQVIKLAAEGRLTGLVNQGTSIKARLTPGQDPREFCLNDDHPDLAYKARPLDGIWATPPYLHNGSVPTLYDLLLPARQRPATFWTGSRQYDPSKAGFVNRRTGAAQDFLFRARDGRGNPVRGNGNQGHEYGVDALGHADRMALVEYLKSL